VITPHGTTGHIIDALLAGSFDLFTSPLLLSELEGVLKRPKFRAFASAAAVEEFVSVIRRTSTVVRDPGPSSGPLTADPKDDYLVALADAAGVDVLVSGDSHLLDATTQIPVLTPREFLDLLRTT